MITLKEWLSNDVKWVLLDEKTMKMDYDEYKLKEEKKWRSRSEKIGAKFPFFENFNDFKDKLKKSEIIKISDNFDKKIQNRSRTKSIEDLKDLVSSYFYPRDVDRIYNGMINGDKIPLLIIIKGNKGMWIFAGNTRLDVAGILNFTKKAILIDLSEN